MASYREEYAAERFEDAIDAALKLYDGQIPFCCNYCGQFDTRSELVVCTACGSKDVNTNLSRMEFAELIGLMDSPPEKDDNPIENEDFWARCDYIRKRRS